MLAYGPDILLNGLMGQIFFRFKFNVRVLDV